MDGGGNVHECGPSDDLFEAAVGSIGAMGIISEVVVEGVERGSHLVLESPKAFNRTSARTTWRSSSGLASRGSSIWWRSTTPSVSSRTTSPDGFSDAE